VDILQNTEALTKDSLINILGVIYLTHFNFILIERKHCSFFNGHNNITQITIYRNGNIILFHKDRSIYEIFYYWFIPHQ